MKNIFLFITIPTVILLALGAYYQNKTLSDSLTIRVNGISASMSKHLDLVANKEFILENIKDPDALTFRMDLMRDHIRSYVEELNTYDGFLIYLNRSTISEVQNQSLTVIHFIDELIKMIDIWDKVSPSIQTKLLNELLEETNEEVEISSTNLTSTGAINTKNQSIKGGVDPQNVEHIVTPWSFLERIKMTTSGRLVIV